MKLENSQVLDKDIKRCILNGKLLVIFQKLNCKAICWSAYSTPLIQSKWKYMSILKHVLKNTRWQIAEESQNPELHDFLKHFRAVAAIFG
jgi:predicted NodU family carbamoyl transferase